MNPSRTLAESILKDLNLGELSSVDKEKALSLIETRFEELVMDVVLKSLSEEDFAKFRALAQDENAENAIAEFIATRPELSQKIGQRLEAEREMMKAAIA